MAFVLVVSGEIRSIAYLAKLSSLQLKLTYMKLYLKLPTNGKKPFQFEGCIVLSRRHLGQLPVCHLEPTYLDAIVLLASSPLELNRWNLHLQQVTLSILPF